ncbi:DUF3225 domain-containing protein [Rhodococcus triatomae]|uniref:Asp-tRNAAsn/Glu-tRNAGln amidotransferase A subunit n=1 Tax=Rhodococcus triatomae TaxID=300028 RepID=A0A1G8L440_9NOCA|nr:AtzH-like domain-containing protein [Rhodococcus triatomae]QNG21560.1 DUF3225 domain-containing protein [Rhodococcus triatomae]QNG25701.1 DUF3225 domain-containing protein [Rhodococcus triatomae]SDI50442.1 Asp-tRNAAsn/Glu-tRNAGln amidotransferase A subunit [Rhodococcus triatomae]
MDLATCDPDLRVAFARYERALMRNDVDELDTLFARGHTTIRSDGGRTLVGHEAIAQFRAGRSGAPRRELRRVHVRPIGPSAAVIVAESIRISENGSAEGDLAVQTQVWERDERCGWVVTTAHVSTSPRPVYAPVDPGDARIWRSAHGAVPPAIGADDGPLRRRRIAVKDLFAVEGHPIGAGNPRILATAEVEPRHARAVADLLVAGADVVGIAHTDELAFSLSGTNAHYGTPPNPAAPGHVPGGSTSGPASAVAAGAADIGLGTDTAGSVRVPASHCGLYGLRTTHGAVSREGLVGLAPSFDSVGVLTRDAGLLRSAANALLPAGPRHAVDRVVWVPELTGLATPAAAASFTAGLEALTLRDCAAGPTLPAAVSVSLDYPPGVDLDGILAAFRVVQAAEAWRLHGTFVTGNGDALDPAVRARFAAGRTVDAATESEARAVLTRMRASLHGLLPPGTVLALPATSSGALPVAAEPEAVERTRAATLRLTCLASLAGLPALSMPLLADGALPLGLCLIAGPDEDHTLLDFAVSDPAVSVPAVSTPVVSTPAVSPSATSSIH